MFVQRVRLAVLLLAVCLSSGILAPECSAQNPPAQPPVPPAPKIQAPAAQVHGAVRLTLDEAIQLALEHNHNLKAAETTIQQDQALEITANLRPNPTLTADAQFLPIFQPENFNADYVNTTAQFDLGIAYLFDGGRKRQ